jgi:hypothetical protein
MNTFFTENPSFQYKNFAFRTQIKRTTSGPINSVLDGFNNLLRSNQSTYGYFVLDTEANNPEFSIASGDTTNTTYYNSDGIHPKTAGNALIATRDGAPLLSWLLS